MIPDIIYTDTSVIGSIYSRIFFMCISERENIVIV